MTRWFFLLSLLLVVTNFQAKAGWFGDDDPLPQVQIIDPFVNLHTGPASGYPVFHVALRGDWVAVEKRRTHWFKVITEDGTAGWVSAADIQQTLSAISEPVVINDGSFEQFQQRDFEFGVLGGEFEGVPSLDVMAAWVMTENFTAELSYTQALGDFSENQLLLGSITHSTFPEWRLAPYVRLGVGQIRTTPRANLVQSGAESRTSDLLVAGLGMRYYLAQNFLLRVEYQNLLALTERDDNEDVNAWKIGFVIFF